MQMNKHYLILFILLLFSCKKKDAKTNFEITETPKIYHLKTSQDFDLKYDRLFLNHKEYSGFVYELSKNQKDTLSVEGYLNGILNGISKQYYPNGQLMESRHYKKGEKHGKQIAFWENSNKRFEFTAVHDVYEGELKEFSIEGKLFHLATFKNGQEEGTQKMWYENGKIRANYVMRNGKRYGLLGTKNCKNVSDSVFVVK